VWQSALIYFLGFMPYEENGGSYWLSGSLIFTIVVITVNLKVFNDTSSHSLISVVLCYGSILVYVISIYFLDKIERSELYGTAEAMIKSREFYIVIIFATLGIVFIDAGINFLSMEHREKVIKIA
jgi:drug/metabolite transporter (DMT)-like permease